MDEEKKLTTEVDFEKVRLLSLAVLEMVDRKVREVVAAGDATDLEMTAAVYLMSKAIVQTGKTIDAVWSKAL